MMDIKIILTIIQYVLLKTGHHWDFDNILSGEQGITDSDISKLEPGDLILRAAMDPVGKLIYHAGVYSGDNKVIHFTSQTKKVTLSWSVSSEEEGIVEEICVKTFINDQTFFAFRLKSGIPKNFKSIVEMTLKYYTKKYNLLTNNCLHFAFSLLGVELENNIPKPNHHKNLLSDLDMDIVLKPNDIYKDFLRSLTWTWTNFICLSGLIMNPHHYLGVYMNPCHIVNIVDFFNDIIFRVPNGCALVGSIFVCT